MLSSTECQQVRGEPKKTPHPGVQRGAWFEERRFPPPPESLPKFSGRRGKAGDAAPDRQAAGDGRGGVTGGFFFLGGEHEAAEEAKGCFKKKPGGDQAAGGRRRRNRARSERDAPSGTGWDRSPAKGEKLELHSPERGGERGKVSGEGDASRDRCHLRLAGTDPAKPNGVCTGLGSCCLSVVPAQISISN